MSQVSSVEAIFFAALEKPSPEERAAYLDEVCANDTDVRRRVERLLDAHPKIGSFMQAAASGPDAAQGDPLLEPPGTHLGPYKLLQQIGEGGMGVVYMAEQESPVRRRVALKIIKPGMDSNQVIARFEAERQALAMMDHQNIARVLDAGTTEVRGQGSGVSEDRGGSSSLTPDPSPLTPSKGRPYFVMELIHGVPITKYCDDNHLTPRQRLELFVPVCQAVQHAHQKGIIHRDIKPTNVMVCLYDGKPVPKVIDFGVAKATEQRLTERTLFTQFGTIVGTFEYMAPEQAEASQLGVDTRSDIYSLGVLLYELLTGTPPLQRQRLHEAGYAEILRLIREEESPKPSTRLSSSGAALAAISAQRGTEPSKLTRLVRGDLDWIVMKALEKDRTRRYETATGLADDIGHYLADEPVLACPPSAGYRLRKFLRRNKRSATVAAVVLMALVAGTIAATLGLVEARQQRDAAEQARLHEAEQRTMAVANEHRAKEEEAKAKASQKHAQEKEAQARAAEADTRAVVTFFREKVLAAPRPKGRDGGMGFDVTLRAAVDAAEPQIAATFRDAPMPEAVIRETLGMTYNRLGEYGLAIGQFERALELWRAKLGPDNRGTLQVMGRLGATYDKAGRHKDGLALLEKTVRMAKAKWGLEDGVTLAAMNNLGMAYWQANRHEEAMPLLKETYQRYLVKPGPNHEATLTAMANLAVVYTSAGHAKDAVPLLEKTVKLRRLALGNDDPETLVAMGNLASGYQRVGRLADALPLFKETLQRRMVVLGPHHPQTMLAMRELAQAYKAASLPKDAVPLLEELLKLQKAKLAPDHPNTLATMTHLAKLYLDVKQPTDAVPLLEGLWKLQKDKLEPDDSDRLLTMNNLAVAYMEAKRFKDAVPLLEELWELLKAKLGADDLKTLVAMDNLALSYLAASQPQKAEPLRRDLVAYCKNKTGVDSTQYAGQLAYLGLTLLAQNKPADAEPVLRDCLAIRAKKLPDDWSTFSTKSMLGGSLLGQKKYADAEPLLLEGYAGMKERESKILPVGQDRLLEALERIVQLYEATDRPAQAEKWRETLASAKRKQKQAKK